jgi:hypothetical protein
LYDRVGDIIAKKRNPLGVSAESGNLAVGSGRVCDAARAMIGLPRFSCRGGSRRRRNANTVSLKLSLLAKAKWRSGGGRGAWLIVFA